MINAYVSHLLEALVPDIAPHEPYRCVELTGVILFVDIVDSTSIVEQLAAGGPEGAERLGALFNDYFAYVFDVVGAHGGDVIRIHGDAVLGLWRGDTGGNSAATVAALEAAASLREGSWLSRETGVRIKHRVLVSSGSMLAMVLRWADEQSFFLLSGPAIDALKSLDTKARIEEALAAGAPLHAATPTRNTAAAGREADVSAPSDACSSLAESAPLTRRPLPAAIARKFIARMVAGRIANAEDGWLAEFRVVSMVYVHLHALQSASVERMDAAVRVIQDTIGVFDIALFDLLVGDKGVVALIACGVPPFARERNAVRALQAARQIRARLGAIHVDSSIGVATGRAFCGDVGNAFRRECLVTGTVMHTGARLMQAANGAVLCDSATARAASDHFEFVEPMLLALKGLPDPVSVYRADTLDEKSHALPDTAGATVHGRAEELGRITTAFNDLESGRRAVLVIEGEPGAGKSRLLAHVAAEARARQMAFADTATSSVELTTAYYACRWLLKGLLLAPADPPNAGPALLRQRLMEALGDHPLQAKAALLEDVLPLGIEDKGLAKEIAGPARLSGIEELFVHIATRRARSRASVIVVDDVH